MGERRARPRCDRQCAWKLFDRKPGGPGASASTPTRLEQHAPARAPRVPPLRSRDCSIREPARRWLWSQYLQSHPRRSTSTLQRAHLESHSGQPELAKQGGRHAARPCLVPPQRPRGQRGVLEVFFHQERAPVARSACASGLRAAVVAVVNRERAGAGVTRRGALGEKNRERPEPRRFVPRAAAAPPSAAALPESCRRAAARRRCEPENYACIHSSVGDGVTAP